MNQFENNLFLKCTCYDIEYDVFFFILPNDAFHDVIYHTGLDSVSTTFLELDNNNIL